MKRLFLCLLFCGSLSLSFAAKTQSATDNSGGPRSKWDRHGFDRSFEKRKVRKLKKEAETKEERDEIREEWRRKRYQIQYCAFLEKSAKWKKDNLFKMLLGAAIFGLLGVLIEWSWAVLSSYFIIGFITLLSNYLSKKVRVLIWKKRKEKYEMRDSPE